ncbi:MAG: hypothetical protein AAGF81_09575 [Pseudomonadota bacterium]
MTKLPGTDVDVALIAKGQNGFAPIFYETSGAGAAMASVNAGNSEDLYVGGGGINAGFAQALAGQNLNAYETRHKALVQQVRSGGEAHITYEDDNPTAFSLLNADQPLTDGADAHDGMCFVDMFGTGLQPGRLAENAGMIYVASPFGGNFATEALFLGAISTLAETIVLTVGSYNAVQKPARLPDLEVVRLCLYGSGIYNTHGTPAPAIALAILQGLARGLSSRSGGIKTIEAPDAEPWHLALADL